ncbi:hypothetical protein RO3G_16596 [Lichtheimia corymbifera JMRC:FSU:9682]|uniref:DM2 domain-containing protein n=1 Tax=Lichtheimia corymbifera JMRC:FSU:9682 TaxID=1263082 RepID=A0A068SCE8_9FUNG|nr:hypothetical protein RO3G_16596 [Lichtheimia corymbifera JMRC:FSU:9682]CDH59650.1 hypothetical protein RO3G_16596 [Lichtheimia corymbifera JMRC:FSU:9682]
MEYGNYNPSLEDLNAYGSLGYKPVASPVYPSSKPDPTIGSLSYYRSGDQHQQQQQQQQQPQGIPPPTPVAIPVTMGQTSAAGGNPSFMDGSMNDFSPYQQFNHTFQLNDPLTQQTSSAAAAAAAVAAMHHPHQQHHHHQPLYNQPHPHATGHVMMPPQWQQQQQQQQQHHQHQQHQQHMRRGSYQQPSPHPSMYRAPPAPSASPYQQPYYAAPAPMGTPSPTTAAAAMMGRYHQHPQQHQLQQMQGQLPMDMNQKKRKGMEDFGGELAVPKKKTRAKKKRVKEPVDPNAPPKPKRKTGLNKPLILSPELSAFVGGDPEMSRPDIVKKLWKYIKDNNLQDPADRRYILCDDQLKTIFDQDRVNSFGMNRDLSKHLTKKEEPAEITIATTTTPDDSATTATATTNTESSGSGGGGGGSTATTATTTTAATTTTTATAPNPAAIDTSPAVTAETPDVVTPKEGEPAATTTT